MPRAFCGVVFLGRPLRRPLRPRRPLRRPVRRPFGGPAAALRRPVRRLRPLRPVPREEGEARGRPMRRPMRRPGRRPVRRRGPCGVPCGGPCGVPCGGPCGVGGLVVSKHRDLVTNPCIGRALGFENVQNLLGAPRLKMACQTIIRHCVGQYPKRVINPVAVQNGQELQRFVVGFGFTEMGKKLFPSLTAWQRFANAVQSGC